MNICIIVTLSHILSQSMTICIYASWAQSNSVLPVCGQVLPVCVQVMRSWCRTYLCAGTVEQVPTCLIAGTAELVSYRSVCRNCGAGVLPVWVQELWSWCPTCICAGTLGLVSYLSACRKYRAGILPLCEQDRGAGVLPLCVQVLWS